MEWTRTPQQEHFRNEARAWLSTNVPRTDRPPRGPEVREFDERWQRLQFEGGWSGIDWPVEYGGRGLSLAEQIIWYEELARANAPTDSVFAIALGHAAPTLMALGTEDQKQRYLGPILRGETPWCQGFSEPGAGSDLAAIRTSGALDRDVLRVTGQKVWTSYAEHADLCELLVRTDQQSTRHRGISWVILDLHAKGVEVRPIAQMDGHLEFCEIFLEDVHVPLRDVVGGINNGWKVAMTTLAFERGPGFLDWRLALIPVLDELIQLSNATRNVSSEIASQLAFLRAESLAVWSMAYLQVSELDENLPGAESTVSRVFFSEFQQRIAQIALEVIGPESIAWNRWSQAWLTDFRMSIGSGTTDIQRNIIGERLLGLPR